MRVGHIRLYLLDSVAEVLKQIGLWMANRYAHAVTCLYQAVDDTPPHETADEPAEPTPPACRLSR